MGSPLKKFVQRDPRYVLKPEDDHYLRFAYNKFSSVQYHTFRTRFVNLSISGLAFVTNHDSAPKVGHLPHSTSPREVGRRRSCAGRLDAKHTEN